MGVGAVERAFQLAPECDTIEDLRSKLVREGYTDVDGHLQGTLRRDLVKLVKKQR